MSANLPSRVDAGRVIFSHYDKSGNAKNIVAIDISEGVARTLAEGERDPLFVAESPRYLVYSTEGRIARPLVVIDKITKKRVASIRLLSQISWGYIEGNRLFVAQTLALGSGKSNMLVYRLPDLKLERIHEIMGDGYFAVWGDKIISLGNKLAIYDRDFKEVAIVDMPSAIPDLGVICYKGPLRIYGNRAVVGSNCRQLAVIDLASARVERVVITESNFQSFDLSEGLLFTENLEGEFTGLRVLDIASGRELSRLNMDASFIAIDGGSLLAFKKRDLFEPSDVTVYEVDFSVIRSENSRATRAINGCRAASDGLNADGDLHAALYACEMAGVLGYVEETDLSLDLREVVEKYGFWLTLSLSRYTEGLAILEHLQRAKPDARIAYQIAITKRKAGYLDLPSSNGESSHTPDRRGVSRASVDIGGFSRIFQFDGDRLYFGRWGCGTHGDPGVTLDVLDRMTLKLTERIVVANCDDDQQDAISTIAVVPGYVVLGMEYRQPEAGRPTVAIVDALSLKVVKKAFVKQPITSLRRWNGRLIDCKNDSNRFDPANARYVPGTEDEVRACANGDSMDPLPSADRSDDPVAQTARYRVYEDSRLSNKRLRVTNRDTGASRVSRAFNKWGVSALAVPNRDALLLSTSDGKNIRFTYYDIETGKEVALFELDPQRRDVRHAVWGRFLLVTMGWDLLVYDLEQRMVIDYEKGFIREGSLDNCCEMGSDRNTIMQLMLDGDRLIALTFDGVNSRIIDLPMYTGQLSSRDFFTSMDRR